MPGNSAAIAAAEPSFESLSRTMSSYGTVVSATTLRRQSRVIARVLKLMTMIETSGSGTRASGTRSASAGTARLSGAVSGMMASGV